MKNLLILSTLAVALSSCKTTYVTNNYPSNDDVYYRPSQQSANNYTPANNGNNSNTNTPQDSNNDYSNGNSSNGNNSNGNGDYYDSNYSSSTSQNGGNTYVTNNYYDDYYDYAYSSRIRRFYNPVYNYGYYDNFYTNMYYYNYDPFSSGQVFIVPIVGGDHP